MNEFYAICQMPVSTLHIPRPRFLVINSTGVGLCAFQESIWMEGHLQALHKVINHVRSNPNFIAVTTGYTGNLPLSTITNYQPCWGKEVHSSWPDLFCLLELICKRLFLPVFLYPLWTKKCLHLSLKATFRVCVGK